MKKPGAGGSSGDCHRLCDTFVIKAPPQLVGLEPMAYSQLMTKRNQGRLSSNHTVVWVLSRASHPTFARAVIYGGLDAPRSLSPPSSHSLSDAPSLRPARCLPLPHAFPTTSHLCPRPLHSNTSFSIFSIAILYQSIKLRPVNHSKKIDSGTVQHNFYITIQSPSTPKALTVLSAVKPLSVFQHNRRELKPRKTSVATVLLHLHLQHQYQHHHLDLHRPGRLVASVAFSILPFYL